MDERLMGEDQALQLLHEELESALAALEKKPAEDREDLPLLRKQAAEVIELSARLLRGANSARFERYPVILPDEWAYLSLYSIIGINHWLAGDFWDEQLAKFDRRLNEILKRWMQSDEKDKFTPDPVELFLKSGIEDVEGVDFEPASVASAPQTNVDLAFSFALRGPLSLLIEPSRAWPWNPKWLLPDLYRQIQQDHDDDVSGGRPQKPGLPDLAGEYGFYLFLLTQNPDPEDPRSLEEIMKETGGFDFRSKEEFYAYLIENWFLSSGYQRSLQRYVDRENEEQGSLHLVNVRSLDSLDALDNDTNPPQAEAEARQGMPADDPEESLGSLGAEPEALDDPQNPDFREGKEDELTFDGTHELEMEPDRIFIEFAQSHPYLLEGRIPGSLPEFLAAFDVESLRGLAENLDMGEENGVSTEEADAETLRLRLATEIPKRFAEDIRSMNGYEFRLFLTLNRQNNLLTRASAIVSLNDALLSGYVFLVRRDTGFRVCLPRELSAILDRYSTQEGLENYMLFSAIREAATALTRYRGVAKQEDVTEILNRLYPEAIQKKDFAAVRRMVRETLEIQAKSETVAFSYQRPYIYSEAFFFEEAMELDRHLEALDSKPKKLTQEEITAAGRLPFIPETDEWFDLTDALEEDLKAFDWATESTLLMDLFYSAVQNADFAEILSILADYRINIEEPKRIEEILRAYTEFANVAPLWRLGGYSLKEQKMPVSYEERLQSSIEAAEQTRPQTGGDQGHHHGHDHDHHDHSHDHDHHHHDHGHNHH